MANELIINASLPETRIALMENGEIQELLIERASGKGIVGNIYKGRVTRVLPGMQAAFVDIGLEKAAFLYVDDVYVHSEIWEEEEGTVVRPNVSTEVAAPVEGQPAGTSEGEKTQAAGTAAGGSQSAEESTESQVQALSNEVPEPLGDDDEIEAEVDLDDEDLPGDPADDEDEESGPQGSTEMGRNPSDDSDGRNEAPEGTVAEASTSEGTAPVQAQSQEGGEGDEGEAFGNSPDAAGQGSGPGRRRHRRGRRGGKFRRRPTAGAVVGGDAPSVQPNTQKYPENYHEQVQDAGETDSDRAGVTQGQNVASENEQPQTNRPEAENSEANDRKVVAPVSASDNRSEFRAQRSRDRRIRPKTSSRPVRAQVNIQDLLKEGQEVLVQVAKDPIATKGARLTCHISLPGRHLVCMPTIDHVGVSRRIEREDERRRLREYVERNRPRNLGFIVRTASGKQQSEKRIKQDIDYLTRLWNEIREKAGTVSAPALVYEDLNAVLRAVRDWVTEEIDKVIVDSRYHYNELHRFVSHFMPPLKQKVELYHGDIPIFDAYGISTELSRALERKVWLKSGGYIVIDQAEALVAIDVNTGRYVGKKNLEDTILKTNLEAVQEIAYQLRLRNCGGIIILDFIDMEKDENRHRVYRALEDALARDRARPTILKISELGLVEMTRKRTRDTIVRTLCESCTFCEGKGFIKAKQTVAYEVMREIEREGIERDINKILVQAHPEVIDILAIDERETLDQLEKKYRKQIYLQGIHDFHPEQFEVTAEKRERSERGHDRDERREERHERHSERHQRKPRHEATITPVIRPLAEPIVKVGQDASGPASVAADAKLQDSENIGNAADSTKDSQKSAHGNEQPSGNSIGNSAGNSVGKTGNGASEDGFDEEDRLAFLRAQAAQDAALARLASSGGHPTNRTVNDPNRDRGGAGRRGVRGRRGGGKFRRGADRGRGGGGKGYGYHSQGHSQNSGPVSSGPRWNDSKDSGGSSSQGESSGGGSGSGGDTSGSGTGAGGGGDHSQPPV